MKMVLPAEIKGAHRSNGAFVGRQNSSSGLPLGQWLELRAIERGCVGYTTCDFFRTLDLPSSYLQLGTIFGVRICLSRKEDKLKELLK
jgi:hypothetical protein